MTVLDLVETYVVQVYAPDDLRPDQIDWANEQREAFDAALRKLVKEYSGENSALSVRIETT